MSMATITETERSRIKNWQWGIIVLAILAEIFLAADWYGFAAVLTFVSGDIKLQPWEAGFAQGIFAIAYGLGMFFWSPVSRTMTARRMLVIGLIGSGIGMASRCSCRTLPNSWCCASSSGSSTPRSGPETSS